MKIFKELVKDPLKRGLEHGDDGISTPLELLNKFTNNINKGQFIAIGGKANSGKTSYMDFVYMMTVYKWWKDIPEDQRPPLKFIYFNMKHSWKNKFQKWVCLYLKIEYNRIIDINTLNSGVGRLYDLDEDVTNEIMTAESFFDEMESEGVLEIINGQQTPTSVYNRVRHTMAMCGNFDNKSNKYSLNSENIKQFTMVFIDNADYLLTESEGFGMLTSDQLKKKLIDYIFEFKSIYNITTCVVVPSKYIGKSVKENEPNYKEMGLFGVKPDLALVLYNPFNEGNNNYLSYSVKDFVLRGKNRLRTATIVRNSTGIENITKGLFFVGECGYFAEAPRPEQENEIFETLDVFSRLP
jgi:hypothetical protein